MNYDNNRQTDSGGLPPFEELDQREIYGFMQNFLGLNLGVAQIIESDSRAMNVVQEAYGSFSEAHPRAPHMQKVNDFIRRLDVIVREIAEASRSGSDKTYYRN